DAAFTFTFTEDDARNSAAHPGTAAAAAAAPAPLGRQEDHDEASRAVATSFAERGMTADERRRWEEEERQLDEEIARTGRAL
ncbi:hypothetical protein E4U41_000595, partial [Claviceps citrina]